jgi:ATP-dependent exoDNAse (exonuclease V) beta subunit
MDADVMPCPGDGGQLPSFACDRILGDKGLSAGFGTWCHALIEHAVQQMERGWSPSSALLPEDPIPLMPRLVSDALDSQQACSDLGVCALQAARQFLESRLFEELCRNKPLRMECEAEFALRTSIDGSDGVLLGSIDLLVVYPHEARIVDFKTDYRYLPALHARQLAVYREAVAKSLGLPVQSVLCYLRDPSIIVWESDVRDTIVPPTV